MKLKTAIIMSACIFGILVFIPIILGNAIQAGQNFVTASVMSIVILGFGTFSESHDVKEENKAKPKK